MADETTIDTILRTKLHRPPVSGDHVHRPRLLEYLDQRRKRPLGIVSAPAGYGKSVLISCWLETSDIPNAWVSLDEHDTDLRQFLIYFLAAIQTIFPDAVNETMTLSNASSLPPLSVLGRSLANELDSIAQDFIVVLDDIHRVQGKTVYDFLSELLSHPLRPLLRPQSQRPSKGLINWTSWPPAATSRRRSTRPKRRLFWIACNQMAAVSLRRT